jgi:toxin ParE1/3/4
MAKVVWTDCSISDLDSIGEFISRDSLKYAEITVTEIFEAVDILEIYPESGSIVPEFDNPNIRQLIIGNYRIVYYIVDNHRIDVLTVHNCARLITNNEYFIKNNIDF